MAALALEVNDAGLLALREGQPRPEPESPSIALFENDEVLTGRAAASRAFLRPRAVHDTYFDSLDTDPLPRPFPAGVRRADLGYVHLVSLVEGLPERPDEAVLAVPGFWTAPHLGLLLGVSRAAGLPVTGLVDSAVAAASLVGGHGDLLHVDLTRHRAVVTALSTDGEVERTAVAATEGLGQHAFEERVVGDIARRFVVETRFDPLHSGEAEQALHDALPGWLFELRREEACPASLTAGGREHRIQLARADLTDAVSDLLRSLLVQVRSFLDANVTRLLVSARVSRFPGAVEQLRKTTGLDVLELPADTTVSATLRNRDHLRHPGPALPFVTRLPFREAKAPHPLLVAPGDERPD
jgi:hypothetical protein